MSRGGTIVFGAAFAAAAISFGAGVVSFSPLVFWLGRIDAAGSAVRRRLTVGFSLA